MALSVVGGFRLSDLAKLISRARKASELTQTELAETAGISRVMVTRAEAGDAKPQTFIDLLAALASAGSDEARAALEAIRAAVAPDLTRAIEVIACANISDPSGRVHPLGTRLRVDPAFVDVTSLHRRGLIVPATKADAALLAAHRRAVAASADMQII